MEHILMREASPLTPEQWAAIDTMVNRTAAAILTGRRIASLYGPLGFGAYVVPLYSYTHEGGAIHARLQRQLPLTTIEHDFTITVRDLEQFNSGLPFDLTPAAAAAAACAYAEDKLILYGDAERGVDGLLTVKGTHKLALGNWDEPGAAVQAVGQAVAHLMAEGYFGPFAALLHPIRLVQLQRVYGGRGILESEILERQLGGGLYASPVMPMDQVLILSTQPHYLDIAMGQDLVTAYVETTNLEHRFRVLETLALRIKQPQAIVILA